MNKETTNPGLLHKIFIVCVKYDFEKNDCFVMDESEDPEMQKLVREAHVSRNIEPKSFDSRVNTKNDFMNLYSVKLTDDDKATVIMAVEIPVPVYSLDDGWVALPRGKKNDTANNFTSQYASEKKLFLELYLTSEDPKWKLIPRNYAETHGNYYAGLIPNYDKLSDEEKNAKWLLDTNDTIWPAMSFLSPTGISTKIRFFILQENIDVFSPDLVEPIFATPSIEAELTLYTGEISGTKSIEAKLSIFPDNLKKTEKSIETAGDYLMTKIKTLPTGISIPSNTPLKAHLRLIWATNRPLTNEISKQALDVAKTAITAFRDHMKNGFNFKFEKIIF